jgi:hypothetical protein
LLTFFLLQPDPFEEEEVMVKPAANGADYD